MKTFIVDAFTGKPFTGNPAGVCILENEISEKLMMLIAREVNHSETAFLLKKGDVYSLRWFTPKAEVNLCGHATLASAHILFTKEYEPVTKKIEFTTRSGILKATFNNDLIELDFPQVVLTECRSNEIIEKAFDIKPIYVSKNDKRYLIEIDDTDKLKQIKPDFELLKKSDRGAFIITAKANDGFDFHSRFFAPYVGINEDPVTGSAHCSLAPYWSEKLGKKKMLAFQASERSGVMECEITDNNRVYLRGTAVTMNEMNYDWPVV